ncbi:hypothetical protein [Actinophytocola sediminis]
MDLTTWLVRHTPPRPMIVTVPGGTRARIAVERAVRERGWRPAMSPAEANILVVAGEAGALEPYVRRVWDSVPAPRVRVDVPESVDSARLTEVLAHLHDVDRQRPAGDGGVDDLPMADRADDRDGLRLDQLRVPLGPVLPLWPAGLIVHTRLQGDVVQQASVAWVGAGGDSWLDDPLARGLDSSARLLALAGWPDMAMTAQRLRDDVLAGGPAHGHRRWAARVRRSRVLRWLLAGVGSIPDGSGRPAWVAGDAVDRLYRWLAGDWVDTTQWTVDHLPALLAGSELATARLLVASLDPDLDLLVRHG